MNATNVGKTVVSQTAARKSVVPAVLSGRMPPKATASAAGTTTARNRPEALAALKNAAVVRTSCQPWCTTMIAVAVVRNPSATTAGLNR